MRPCCTKHLSFRRSVSDLLDWPLEFAELTFCISVMSKYAMDELLRFLYVLTYPVTISLYLAQVPMMRAIAASKSAEGYSPLPTLAAIVNCTLWASYGAYTGAGSSVMGVSIAGGLIQLVYICCFLTWSDWAGKVRLLSILAGAATVLALFLGTLFSLRPESGQFILGAVATGGSIAMFSAPIQSVLHALHSHDISHVPVLLTFASLACSCLWGLYGILLQDAFITAPNIAGVLLSSTQLLAVAYVLRVQHATARRASTGKSIKGEAGQLTQAAALFTGTNAFLPLHEVEGDSGQGRQGDVTCPVAPLPPISMCKESDTASLQDCRPLPVSPTVLSMPGVPNASIPSTLSTETLDGGAGDRHGEDRGETVIALHGPLHEGSEQDIGLQWEAEV